MYNRTRFSLRGVRRQEWLAGVAPYVNALDRRVCGKDQRMEEGKGKEPDRHSRTIKQSIFYVSSPNEATANMGQDIASLASFPCLGLTRQALHLRTEITGSLSRPQWYQQTS
ncbi:hypothetical protein E2C01_094757 [Portunus trituberculatus]|uniref:Uncharacterized protein n=1 Tax=Portunus trituberculatus TaxID=210409 RepID=A0A5B7K2I7_PORTR|nr:hypothetical protein [Portunus trituberculatus]